jgi:predicted transport protein
VGPEGHVKIWLDLPRGKLNDPRNLVRDLTRPEPVGHWGNGDYEVVIERVEDLDNIFDLVKQSYECNK